MRQLIFGILALLLCSSCNEGKSIFTPASSGRPYEIMVVVDSDIWEHAAGRALNDILNTSVPGLPQSEPSFRVSNVPNNGFDRILKLCRNVLVVNINPEMFTQTRMKFARDVYASPQVIMTIQSPTEAEFTEYISRNGKAIVDFFNKVELNRLINELRKSHSGVVAYHVNEQFGYDIDAPELMNSYKKGKDFIWTTDNRAAATQNLVIYTFPYTDEQTFTKAYFIHKRDSIMKANLPGEREGMYMTTANDELVETREFALRGEYVFEARGLWEMENDCMGGPFVALARVDKPNGLVVVAEGFVYAPDKNKRNLIRQMEASLYTLRLPQEQNLDEIVVTGGDIVEETK